MTARILLIASMLAWTFSMGASAGDIGPLGLVDALPPAYFAGLLALLASFIIGLEKKGGDGGDALRLAQVAVLIAYLFLTPALIEGTPRFRSAYLVHGFSEYITREGTIDPVSIWYHSWPGASMVLSAATQLLGEGGAMFILRFFPAAIEAIYLFPLFMLLDNLFLDRRKVWAGIWVFYVLNYLNQDYFSPQSVAYLFYLLILAFIVKASGIGRDPGRFNDGPHRFAMIAVFIALAVTHMLTSIIVLVMMAIVSFTPVGRRKGITDLWTFFLVIVAAWTIYGASTYFDWHIGGFLSQAFNLEFFLKKNIGERVVGSAAHQLLSMVMITATVATCLFALAGIVSPFLGGGRRRLLDTRKVNVRMVVLSLAIAVCAPLQEYGGEMLMRVFLFALPFMAFFIAQLADGRYRVLFYAFLLIYTPLHVYTHYGNEEYDYVSPAEIALTGMYPEPYDIEYVSGGYPLRAFKLMESRKKVDFDELAWANGTYVAIEEKDTGLSEDMHYMIFSRGDGIELERYRNDTETIPTFKDNVLNSNNYIKLYSNNDLEIYKLERS